MDMTERIRRTVLGCGLKQKELAERIGVTPAAVNNWLNRGAGQVRPDVLFRLATVTGKNPAWLATGEGPENSAGNVEPGPQARGMVPVISWVAAGTWSEAVDEFHPGDAEAWAPCIASHGPKAYALRVRGDSMTAPHGKSYPDGCLIFVDPDQLDPPSGTPIIAKVNGDDAVTFKVVMRDAGRVWLRALNPAYPPIMEHFRVLGTVIGKWEDA